MGGRGDMIEGREGRQRRRTHCQRLARCDVRQRAVELRQRIERIRREEDWRGGIGELEDEGVWDGEVSGCQRGCAGRGMSGRGQSEGMGMSSPPPNFALKWWRVGPVRTMDDALLSSSPSYSIGRGPDHSDQLTVTLPSASASPPDQRHTRRTPCDIRVEVILVPPYRLVVAP